MAFSERIGDYYNVLQNEVRSSTDFHQSLSSLRNWCISQMPHPDWPATWQFDGNAELIAAHQWIPAIMSRSPSPFPVRGVYLGLGEFAEDDGIEFADLYPGFMAEYDPADREMRWLWCKHRHYPENAYLRSAALKHGGTLCMKPGGIGTTGHICFSLGFACVLLKHVLDVKTYQSLGSGSSIGVVTGFDGGDLFLLGEMTPDGFCANSKRMV